MFQSSHLGLKVGHRARCAGGRELIMNEVDDYRSPCLPGGLFEVHRQICASLHNNPVEECGMIHYLNQGHVRTTFWHSRMPVTLSDHSPEKPAILHERL